MKKVGLWFLPPHPLPCNNSVPSKLLVLAATWTAPLSETQLAPTTMPAPHAPTLPHTRSST